MDDDDDDQEATRRLELLAAERASSLRLLMAWADGLEREHALRLALDESLHRSATIGGAYATLAYSRHWSPIQSQVPAAADATSSDLATVPAAVTATSSASSSSASSLSPSSSSLSPVQQRMRSWTENAVREAAFQFVVAAKLGDAFTVARSLVFFGYYLLWSARFAAARQHLAALSALLRRDALDDAALRGWLAAVRRRLRACARPDAAYVVWRWRVAALDAIERVRHDGAACEQLLQMIAHLQLVVDLEQQRGDEQ